MNGLAKISLLLVILLVSLSAYLRLAHSGIGCGDWPACYGRIGEVPELAQPVPSQDAYQQLLEESNQPLAWATPLHRLVASVLGLLIMIMTALALKKRKQRLISIALLALTVYLAVLGIRSGSLHNPAVVMGNLAGGFCMLALLGWMVFSAGDRPGGSPKVRYAAVAAIVVLSLQILLGGLTSANFAATSCQTLPDCHGSWWPGSSLGKAIDISRQHEVTPSGQAIGGEERLAIHKAHRLGAIVTFILTLAVSLVALRADARFRSVAFTILALLSFEFLIGISAILAQIPIGLAVAHNWFAGLLLLSLIKLLTLTRPSRETGVF
jgi:cytochrome c oxidase assembly protein subunit 15